MSRPEIIEDDHLNYLDELRESGETNMWGATPYVMKEYGISKRDANMIVNYWMDTFGNSDR